MYGDEDGTEGIDVVDKGCLINEFIHSDCIYMPPVSSLAPHTPTFSINSCQSQPLSLANPLFGTVVLHLIEPPCPRCISDIVSRVLRVYLVVVKICGIYAFAHCIPCKLERILLARVRIRFYREHTLTTGAAILSCHCMGTGLR